MSDPVPRFAADLFATVAERLCPEDYSKLKLYGAVNTPFDLFHGVDAFFEYEGRIVTLDLTLNEKKDEYKADFIINPEKTDLDVAADWVISRFNKKAKAA